MRVHDFAHDFANCLVVQRLRKKELNKYKALEGRFPHPVAGQDVTVINLGGNLPPRCNSYFSD